MFILFRFLSSFKSLFWKYVNHFFSPYFLFIYRILTYFKRGAGGLTTMKLEKRVQIPAGVDSVLKKDMSQLLTPANDEQQIIIFVMPGGVSVAKWLTCALQVSVFELQSRYNVYFETNTLGKGISPYILFSYEFVVNGNISIFTQPLCSDRIWHKVNF